MSEELQAEVVETPPETPPAAEAPPPPVAAAPPAPPAEDVEGIKSALIAERRRRQDLERELEARNAPPKPPDPPDVTDDEAERFAKHYELYTANGLDISRAKRMIKDQRDETRRVATEAAQQAVEPLKQTTATQASRQNFVWAASQKDADGNPLVDPTVLAETWANFPAELTAQPEVAKIVLQSVVGHVVMSKPRAPKGPEREPTFSEPSGGRAPAYTISSLERKVADAAKIAPKDWEARAKNYQPGVPNTLE